MTTMHEFSHLPISCSSLESNGSLTLWARTCPTPALSLRLSVGEQGIRTEVRPATEPYLSLTGQELAPGHCCLVAVASSGLNPLPLWISAAVRRHTGIAQPNEVPTNSSGSTFNNQNT